MLSVSKTSCLSTSARRLDTCGKNCRPIYIVYSKRPLHLARPKASEGESTSSPATDVIENLDSEASRKKRAAERLRAAEKFMVVGAGDATCKGCGYMYKPENGDPEFPIPKGMKFQELPEEYVCPVCGAPKERFDSRTKVVAGFAENQSYGLGTNSMTSEQKQLLIYGSLALFFALFIAGYGLE